MTDVLATTKTTRPGVYIGRIFQPSPTGVAGFTRLPCLVGKGNRLFTQSNAAIRRSYIDDKALTFTAVAPYVASLLAGTPNGASNGDQTIAQLYTSNGPVVAANKWMFTESTPGSGIYDQVEILTEIYDPNVTYYINYQSTSRSIEDPLPFSDLREVRFVGDTQNQEKYIENDHFYIPIDMTEPVVVTQTNAGYGFTSVVATNGTMTVVTAGGASEYTHDYNRRYLLTVTDATGPILCSVRISQGGGGLYSEPPVPVHSSLVPLASLQLSFTKGATSQDSFIDPATGDTITLELNDAGSTVILTNTFAFTGLGPSLVEIDSALIDPDTSERNIRQFGTIGAITHSAGAGTGTIAVSVLAAFVGDHDRKFVLECDQIVPTVRFRWCGYGEATTTEGSLTVTPTTLTNRTVEDGVSLDFGSLANFVVGDTYTFTSKSPMAHITAKDSRDYTLLCGTPVAGVVPLSYTTNTPEGRFGSATVTGLGGYVQLPGGINFYLRNIGTLATENRYAAGDSWTFSTTDEEKINWTLNTRETETISTVDVHQDVLGLVTGTAGNYYVYLTQTPSTVLYVKYAVAGTLLSYATVAGQPLIYFTFNPTASIEVRYEYIGDEPDPGSIYYITANTVRESSLYNIPILSTTWEQAQALLGPSATNNDLLIAAEICLNDNNAPGLYTCQAYDSDEDGVITTTDINTAIIGTEAESGLTDIIVIGSFNSLSTALASNVKCNDPFERKDRALWCGCPSTFTIGDAVTPNTLTYVAKKTLQVYGNNHSHGTRVLVGNVSATKTITLTDGTQVEVSLDGSYVAAAIAALNASFNLPSETLLRKYISGFDSIETYNETEELQLIGANIIFVSNQGSDESPVFRIEESTTVDSSSADNLEISVSINQKQYVTIDLRNSMDNSLIGVVPPSEQAGVAMIQSYVVSKLQQYITAGIISPYTNSNGTTRKIDPATDVEVFRATGNPTLYHLKYWWVGQYGVKRVFGLYSVDTKLWTARA